VAAAVATAVLAVAVATAETVEPLLVSEHQDSPDSADLADLVEMPAPLVTEATAQTQAAIRQMVALVATAETLACQASERLAEMAVSTGRPALWVPQPLVEVMVEMAATVPMAQWASPVSLGLAKRQPSQTNGCPWHTGMDSSSPSRTVVLATAS
jgi:hypothetical protein